VTGGLFVAAAATLAVSRQGEGGRETGERHHT